MFTLLYMLSANLMTLFSVLGNLFSNWSSLVWTDFSQMLHLS